MELSEIKNMAETILRKGCPDMTDYEVRIEKRGRIIRQDHLFTFYFLLTKDAFAIVRL